MNLTPCWRILSDLTIESAPRLFYCMSHKLLKYEFYEIFHILHNMCNISWPPTSSVQQTSASHNGIDQNLTDIGVWNIADKQWSDGSMAGYHSDWYLSLSFISFVINSLFESLLIVPDIFISLLMMQAQPNVYHLYS